MAATRFLIPVAGGPASIDKSGDWSKIATKEGWQDEKVITHDKANSDVSIKVPITASWKLTFSSAGNDLRLGDGFDVSSLKNSAWLGDDKDSGIMVLNTPDSDSHGLGDVLKAFGVSGNHADSQAGDFLQTMALDTFSATIYDPPTSKDLPNALWCLTREYTYSTVLRLSFKLGLAIDDPKGPLAKVVNWANRNFGLSISLDDVKKLPDIKSYPILITLMRTNFYTPVNLDASSTYSLSFQFPGIGFDCLIDLSPLGLKFSLRPSGSVTAVYGSIQNALFPSGNSELNGSDLPSGGSQDSNGGGSSLFSEFFSHIRLWYVTVNKPRSRKSLSWEVQVIAGWTIKQQNIVVALGYESALQKFTGRLVLSGDLPDALDKRYPTFDRRFALSPDLLNEVNIKEIPQSINLWQLFSDSGTPPRNIPDSVTAAMVSYQTLKASNSSVFMFSIAIDGGGNNSPDPGEPPSGFSWDNISVLASITKSRNAGPPVSTSTVTDIQISSTFSLVAKNDPSILPARLFASLRYTSGTNSQWVLQGQVRSLSVALLADYFDADSKQGAMAVLGNLQLKSLDMMYTYNGKAAASFLISAVIQLGGLELDLDYQYVGATNGNNKTAASLKYGSTQQAPVTIIDKSWAFEARLSLDSRSATIASVAESIVPGAAAKIPNFVGDIALSPKSTSSDQKSSPVKLSYRGSEAEGSLLIVSIDIAFFHLTFVQYRTAKLIKAGVATTPVTKRILRISIDQIPLINNIPLVEELPQPFDQLVYLWVEDDSRGQKDQSQGGFTRESLDKAAPNSSKVKNINKVLSEEGILPIPFKETKKTPADSDLLLQGGHHFVIIANGEVVLDHLFNASRKPPATLQSTPPLPSANARSGSVVGAETTVTTRAATINKDTAGSLPEAPITKGGTNKQAGPLSISGLSLQYKHDSLFIGVDASLVLGPLTFAVKGFTIEIEISKVKLNDLSALITDHLVHVSLHGLEVGVSKQPLTIEGVFIHDEGLDQDGNKIESYRGGVAVGFKAWAVLAVGEYRITTIKSTTNQYKSVFIFGKLDGPLVQLEFATISGVRVGFGFNSTVYLPSADMLYTFPFINDKSAAGAGNDPMKVLDSMITPQGNQPAYVSSKDGGCWFCAGMTITCFDCITLTAVLMFEVDTKPGQTGAKVALLADGVFQMEPLVPADLSLFYVEVLIKVELNFTDGYLAADAVLAPASHVYVPQAHLVGSASFYSWFTPNSHAGDWVVSIGGYNKSYNIPSHYPRPSRLGLNFTIGDNIQVLGVGYAAVTPKCAMAGGRLHMSLDVGPVSAYCDIILDVYVNFKPFYFIAGISLSVGVSCNIDILFVHFHVSISIGADLTIWGPDSFGGLAHVDFWFFGFDIRFGDGRKQIPGISLSDFYEMVRTPGPESTPPSTDKSGIDPYREQHKYSIEQGLFPQAPRDETKDFPNTGAATEWLTQNAGVKIRIDCDFSISSAAIVTNEKDRKKDYTITLPMKDKKVPPVPSIYSFPMHSDQITSSVEIRIYNDADNLVNGFTAELVIKNAARALWSQYDPRKDPLAPGTPDLNDGSDPNTPLVQAIRLICPEAEWAQSPIVDFDATEAMKDELGPVDLASFDSTQSVYLATSLDQTTNTWPKFADNWSGKTNGQLKGINKSEIRGDGASKGAPATGLLGMCADILGWKKRPTGDKKANAVVVPEDGKMEWDLEGKPPGQLCAQLDKYYPALPLCTSASS